MANGKLPSFVTPASYREMELPAGRGKTPSVLEVTHTYMSAAFMSASMTKGHTAPLNILSCAYSLRGYFPESFQTHGHYGIPDLLVPRMVENVGWDEDALCRFCYVRGVPLLLDHKEVEKQILYPALSIAKAMDPHDWPLLAVKALSGNECLAWESLVNPGADDPHLMPRILESFVEYLITGLVPLYAQKMLEAS